MRKVTVVLGYGHARARVESVQLDVNGEYFFGFRNVHLGVDQAVTAATSKLNYADSRHMEASRQLHSFKYAVSVMGSVDPIELEPISIWE
jgi:hypothetical protein